MKGKKSAAPEQLTKVRGLTATQEVLYQKEFKRARNAAKNNQK